ncbi:MAG: hypothetical protein WC510_01695 [Candidatus Omnitrophota bacterium]
MVRTVDYQTRRRAVLAATIERYIKDASPVASEDVAGEFALSPASIRKIFMDLEDEGYLMQLYTSGGRVPTAKGYRYYVDFLISQMSLLEEERERIDSKYRCQISRLEDVLENTSQVIAEVTHYAGISSFLEWHDRFFYKGISLVLDQPEFQDLGKMRFLIRMIEDKERLLNIINRDFAEKVKVYIGDELGCPEMDNYSLAVSSYRIKDKSCGRVAVLGPMRMEYSHIIPTLDYVSDMLTETLERI